MSRDEAMEQALDALRELEPNDRKLVFKTMKKERWAQEAEIKEEAQQLPNSHWSKKHLLERIPDPANDGYEQRIYVPEFTFMGVGNQPDFGEIYLTFYPSKWTIELKSLKVYKDGFRDALASYERLANVIYDDLMEIYEPRRLRLVMRLRPRGGISSVITIDSDWAVRGGSEEFTDWKHSADSPDPLGGHEGVPAAPGRDLNRTTTATV